MIEIFGKEIINYFLKTLVGRESEVKRTHDKIRLIKFISNKEIRCPF